MKRNRLLSSLPSAEIKRLSPYLEEVPVEIQQVLIRQGEPIPYVWFPRDCVTSTIVESEEGEVIEVGLMGGEGMVGLSLLLEVLRSNTTVIVQVSGTADRMPRDAFMREVVHRENPLRTLLLRYSNAFMAMVAQSAACTAQHELEARFCRWILMTHDRVGKNTLQLTQEFLSMMLGVRRPSVSVTAGVLKRAGLIDYTRGSVTVLDRKGLEENSCSCYATIQHQMEAIFEKEGELHR